MEGRRDYAGDNVAGVERDNVATEQGWRTGSNQGQREAASMLGLSVDETSRRIGFINALSGEARSTAIRSEEHTSELQSLMRISYAVFCLKKKNTTNQLSPITSTSPNTLVQLVHYLITNSFSSQIT